MQKWYGVGMVVLGVAALVATNVRLAALASNPDAPNDRPAPPASRKLISGSGYDLRPVAVSDEMRQQLTPEQLFVTCGSGTEMAFQNEYWNKKDEGIYVCICGGLPLFSSQDKFDSGTGWPSFTRPIDPDHVLLKEDRRYGIVQVEVLDARTGVHLGHVFDDGPSPTGKRYCINSAALKFIPKGQELPPESRPLSAEEQAKVRKQMKQEVALFGAGCFWGVEESFRTLPGVIDTEVGYAGGSVKEPTYKQVCTDMTGHAEVVQITFDPNVISYEKLLDVFWELHDPTQVNRQGPDVGSQYRSAIFFTTPEQEKLAQQSKEKLGKSGKYARPIATEITKALPFWPAEEYHQEYLKKRGLANCHVKP